MTKFTDGFEVYEADKVEVRTVRTVEVIVTIDVSNWGDWDDDLTFSEEALSEEAIDQWLDAVERANVKPNINVESLTVDHEEISVK